jgi:hypothetical protein
MVMTKSFFRDSNTFADGTGKHSYECTVGSKREEGVVVVHATNRNQAVRRLEKAGYMLRDCNMVG